ncbi:MAG TPA: NAD-dependent epimerase/dehydratase family protein [Thermoanaerobaculia bacterium]|nr:NAD-dependent epimerase/dehydratase family protein [Thermoanaerobaculia bacterium]
MSVGGSDAGPGSPVHEPGAGRRALVLGGGGHIGCAVVRELAGRGWRVVGLGRRPALPASLEGVPAEYRVAGPQELELARGCALVVDAAAPYPMDVPALELPALRASALARTDRWLDAAQRAGAVFAYVGSFVTAPAPPSGPWARWERAARHRLHPYFETKRLLEERVLEASRVGLRVAVVQPTTCLGPWDPKPRELSLVRRLARAEIPVALSGRLDVVDVRDVARVLVDVAEGGPWGRPVAAAGHAVTVEMLCTRVAQLAGVEPPRFVADGALLGATSWLADLLAAAAGRLSPSGSLAVALLREGRCAGRGAGAGSASRRRPPISLSRTLVDSLDWAQQLERGAS